MPADPLPDQGPSTRSGPGRIVREADPLNLESPVSSLESFLTPTAQFYIRNHFDVPDRDPATWQIRIEGAVARPFSISPNELWHLPTETRTVTLECAGNGRVFLKPKAKGLLWGEGAVGTAEWQGVPLRILLDRAGIHADAVEVIMEGADSGQVTEEPKTPGVISFARSLPLAKVDDVLIALAMNGAELVPVHGAPVRAIVGGWYGMASVKWLRRIIVTDRPFQGYFQTLEYATFEQQHDIPTLVGLKRNAVKAQIISPVRGELINGGTRYDVRGKAWSGEATITRVEFSADGSQTWRDATVLGPASRHAWQEWSIAWDVPEVAGKAQLMARATDSLGRVQPITRDSALRTYAIHHVIPVEVEVLGPPGWVRELPQFTR